MPRRRPATAKRRPPDGDFRPPGDVDAARTLPAMDGLGRAVGDGISGLVGGAINGITSALGGMIHAVSVALPAGALPVIGIGVLLLVLVAVFRR
jgi:hypothetical protein